MKANDHSSIALTLLVKARLPKLLLDLVRLTLMLLDCSDCSGDIPIILVILVIAIINIPYCESPLCVYYLTTWPLYSYKIEGINYMLIMISRIITVTGKDYNILAPHY